MSQLITKEADTAKLFFNIVLNKARLPNMRRLNVMRKLNEQRSACVSDEGNASFQE